MSNYRVGRGIAVLVSIVGGLLVAWSAWTGASVLLGRAGFLAMALLPQAVMAGLCLILFGSLARAIFDIADRKS